MNKPNSGDVFIIDDDEELVENHAHPFSITDLAREFSVTLRALRFYESRGLLKPQRRGLARQYSNVDRRRLELILKGKRLGFTLTEIMSLIAESETSSQGARKTLRLSLEQITQQISELEERRNQIDIAIAELRQTADLMLPAPMKEIGQGSSS
ncbi:MAG: MerR family DNA-binding transcriptional regulator [Alphaproteobacteria bacterium]|jgi:DNA-binding transcriptional MerR regulator